MPKDMGGFEFRDLWDFNTAMLTKMASRLQDNPTALWAQVVRGMYYPRSDLMEAKRGVHPSWAWSSILQGRDVMLKHGA